MRQNSLSVGSVIALCHYVGMSTNRQDPVPEARLVVSKLMRDQVISAWSTLLRLAARPEIPDEAEPPELQEPPNDED